MLIRQTAIRLLVWNCHTYPTEVWDGDNALGAIPGDTGVRRGSSSAGVIAAG